MPFCKKCGAELKVDTKVCPNCGISVTSSAPSAPAVPSAPSSPQLGSRTRGITLLAILEGIGSFFMLLGGVALIGLSAFLGAGGWEMIPEEVLQQIADAFTGVPIIAFTTSFLMVVGLILLILAVLGFIMTWGLWSGKSWARTITMILAVISIVAGVFSLPGSLVSILCDIVILYYLTRPHIQAYYQ